MTGRRPKVRRWQRYRGVIVAQTPRLWRWSLVVRFRYAPDDDLVLLGISLENPPDDGGRSLLIGWVVGYLEVGAARHLTRRELEGRTCTLAGRMVDDVEAFLADQADAD